MTKAEELYCTVIDILNMNDIEYQVLPKEKLTDYYMLFCINIPIAYCNNGYDIEINYYSTAKETELTLNPWGQVAMDIEDVRDITKLFLTELPNVIIQFNGSVDDSNPANLPENYPENLTWEHLLDKFQGWIIQIGKCTDYEYEIGSYNDLRDLQYDKGTIGYKIDKLKYDKYHDRIKPHERN